MPQRPPISNNQLLTHIYNLLPRYYDDDEEQKLFLDRLRKQLLYVTGSGEPIQERLKAIHFQTEQYSEEQQFLFYLTYLELIYTNRSFIHYADRSDASKKPNEKLIATLKKEDPDYDFREIGFQFLQAHEQYVRIKREEKDNKQFFKKYNDFLIYMHHQVEEALKTKGIQELSKEKLAQRQHEFQIAGSISESADPALYQGEENMLREKMKRLYSLHSDEELLGKLPLQLLEYYIYPEEAHLIKNTPEYHHLYLYDFIFFVRAFLNVSEYCLRRIYQNPEMPDQMKEFFQKQLNQKKSMAGTLTQQIDRVVFKKGYILLAFGVRVLLQQEKRDLEYERRILEALSKESESEESDWYPCENEEPVYVSEEVIKKTSPKQLFYLMIRDTEIREKQQSSNARNTIRTQIHNTIKVMNRLKRQYGIVSDVRNAQYICAMYEELYLYAEDGLKHKQYKSIARDIAKDGEINGTLSSHTLLLLREKQLRGLFRMKGQKQEYLRYIEQRKQFLDEMITLYTFFEGSVDG